MDFPISIGRTSLFGTLGVLGGILHFDSNFNRTFCEQTVETLIRRRILRRLIWVCAVCLCPTKKDAMLIWVNYMQWFVLIKIKGKLARTVELITKVSCGKLHNIV